MTLVLVIVITRGITVWPMIVEALVMVERWYIVTNVQETGAFGSLPSVVQGHSDEVSGEGRILEDLSKRFFGRLVVVISVVGACTPVVGELPIVAEPFGEATEPSAVKGGLAAVAGEPAPIVDGPPDRRVCDEW